MSSTDSPFDPSRSDSDDSSPIAHKKQKGNKDGPKRLQVPKACMNCRKGHSACGVERPCKRCIQNGLAESCVDVPRKKRISKKNPQPNQQQQSQQPILLVLPQQAQFAQQQFLQTPQQQQQQVQLIPSSLTPAGRPGIDDYRDVYFQLFGADNDLKAPTTPNFFNQSSSSMNLNQTAAQAQQQAAQQFPTTMQTGGAAGFGLFNNENFGLNPSLPVMATEFAPPFTPVSPMPQMSVQPIPPAIFGQPLDLKAPPTPSSSSSTNADQNQISYLIQQVNELKQSLMGVNGEISQRRQSITSAPKTVGWYSFQPQEIAISVWKNTSATPTGCGASNVLVECNQKFVDLLGYPISVLQNNFTCGRLLQNPKCTSNDDPKDHTHNAGSTNTNTTNTNTTLTTTTTTNNNTTTTLAAPHSPSSSSSLEQQPSTPHQKENNTQTQTTPQHNPTAHSQSTQPPARQQPCGPKRAVLSVADGTTRSAMITITPVHDSKNFVKYYILHAQTMDD